MDDNGYLGYGTNAKATIGVGKYYKKDCGSMIFRNNSNYFSFGVCNNVVFVYKTEEA